MSGDGGGFDQAGMPTTRPSGQATNGPLPQTPTPLTRQRTNSGDFHGTDEAAADCRQLEDERSSGRRPGAGKGCRRRPEARRAGATVTCWSVRRRRWFWRWPSAAEGSGVLVGGENCHAKVKRRPYRRYRGRDAARLRCQPCHRRPFRTARRLRRDRRHRAGQGARPRGAPDWCRIVCIGETLAEREAGKTLAVLETQLKGSVPAGSTAANLVVAYEPVWAIGTGKTPTTPEVAAAHAHIRKVLGGLMTARRRRFVLLYGGSVEGAAMPPSCWRRATSTAPWSAGPASRRTNFWLSPRRPKAARSAAAGACAPLGEQTWHPHLGTGRKWTRFEAFLHDWRLVLLDHPCRRHRRDDRRHPAPAQRRRRPGHGPHRRAVLGAWPGQRAVAHDRDLRRHASSSSAW